MGIALSLAETLVAPPQNFFTVEGGSIDPNYNFYDNCKRTYTRNEDYTHYSPALMYNIRNDPENFLRCDFRGCNFNGVNLSNMNFAYSNIINCTFIDTELYNTNMQLLNTGPRNQSGSLYIDFTRAHCGGTIFNGSNFTNIIVNCRGARFIDAQFSNVIYGNAIFVVEGAKFENITISGLLPPLPEHFIWINSAGGKWSLVGPTLNMSSTDLTNQDLTGFDLHDGDFTNTVFTNTNLTDVDLTGANLQYVDLTTATLTGATIKEIRNYQDVTLPDSYSWIEIDNTGYLIGPELNLSRYDLTDVDLTGKDLTNCSLYRVTLKNTIIKSITGYNTVLLPTSKYRWVVKDGKGSLIGPNLIMNNYDITGEDLTDIDLTGSKMLFATGYESAIKPSDDHHWLVVGDVAHLVGPGMCIGEVDLSGLDLSGKKLNYVNFDKTNLSNVNLSNADLTGASLVNTTLTNANLEYANLTDIIMHESHIESANTAYVTFNKIPAYTYFHTDRNLFPEDFANEMCEFLYASEYLTESELSSLKELLYDFYINYKHHYYGISNKDSYIALKTVQILHLIENNEHFVGSNKYHKDAYKKYTIRRKVHMITSSVRESDSAFSAPKDYFIIQKSDPNFIEIEQLLHDIHSQVPLQTGESSIYLKFPVDTVTTVIMTDLARKLVYIDKIPFTIIKLRTAPNGTYIDLQYRAVFNPNTQTYDKYYVDMKNNRRYNVGERIQITNSYSVKFESVGSSIARINITQPNIAGRARIGSNVNNAKKLQSRI